MLTNAATDRAQHSVGYISFCILMPYRIANMVYMLGQRRRQWPEVKTDLDQRILLAGKPLFHIHDQSNTVLCVPLFIVICSIVTRASGTITIGYKFLQCMTF